MASAATDLIMSKKIWHWYNRVCILYIDLTHRIMLHFATTGTMNNFSFKYTKFCLRILWTRVCPPVGAHDNSCDYACVYRNIFYPYYINRKA